ncbi:recombinase zinc ribbon domain-containing protein [Campylobacter coli]
MGFGKSLTVRYTNAKYPQQIYSCKTYNAFGKNHCTQHRIDYDTLIKSPLTKIPAKQALPSPSSHFSL